jgi:hypothetical protein
MATETPHTTETETPEENVLLTDEQLLQMFDGADVEIDWGIAERISPAIIAEIDALERAERTMERWNTGTKTFTYRDDKLLDILLAYVQGKPVDRAKVSAMNKKTLRLMVQGTAISYYVHIPDEVLTRQQTDALQIKRTLRSIKIEKQRKLVLGFRFTSADDIERTILALSHYCINTVH